MPKVQKHLTANPAMYIGIDPGQKGGLVCIYSSGKILATAMPVGEAAICDWFRDRVLESDREQSTICAVIEYVRSMPKQGITGAFTFGWGYGGLRMALVANKISFVEAMPKKWQQVTGCPKKKSTDSQDMWKKRLLARAREIFPQLKIQQNVADALLIAQYCREVSR